MTDYTQEQIKDMAVFLSAHPEMVPAELKSQAHVETTPTPGEFAAKNIASTTAQDEIAKLKAELEEYKKTSTYATSIAVQSAIQIRDEEMQAKAKEADEFNKVVSELYSVMAKTTADKLLKDKLPLSALKSMIEVLKNSGAARVGVVCHRLI